MKKNKGFTLLELMISMAVISIILAAVFFAFSIALHVFVNETNQTDIYIEADRGMSRMTSELREGRAILLATSREVDFWGSDLNGNGTIDASEIVKYSWSGAAGGTLVRTVTGETFILSNGVYGLLFSYDDINNPSIVDIKITVGESSNRATLESSVKPRNL